jgi:hypothetical protein
MNYPILFLLGMPGFVLSIAPAHAADSTRHPDLDSARRAAIHPVADPTGMFAWLARVPLTRDFPPDFAAALRGDAPAFVVEMTSTAGCLPCADLWGKLQSLSHQYGFRTAVLSREDALIRSGRLGLPWVGNPVAWVRAVNDPNRVVPIAIGTDHGPNVARNIYLAFKMMTGVRPAVGVRAMAKFTGIVGVGSAPQLSNRGF